ncbi:DNA-binding transcriptional MocR family regulator [Tamaricihabitans halophyticus]|uniref:DNA-binding transcriptional MocR family regulator n=1 Tax=Tamaricihabitans halophyticus TaxID=1262583 RepID=A0A4R2R4L7_9PSEU|nr:PLP-dependent aminotransferase family protein [Tamaricihabitans halophyticus]TCP57523.1 DNA-binding transcriptional MocR family regulator [Tamaricihabitans halophyticus]
MFDYLAVADALAADIAAGRLRAGDRLPPQRRFARQRGIAVSTASRVYGELIRRGLAVGEVGRGTFIRAGKPAVSTALAEPAAAQVDLELNFPVLPEQPAMLAESLGGLLRPDALAEAVRPIGAAGNPRATEAARDLLSAPEWTPECVLFAGNGRQAIAASIAGLVGTGERLGVEAMTYPVVRGIADRLGVQLVPVELDEQGVCPAALRAAGPLRAVYLQPTLHNPLGYTMPAERRAELVAVLRETDSYLIEDAIYGFLRESPVPLAALAPERTVRVDSLSKRVAPGLTVGFLGVPASVETRIAAALRSGGWGVGGFALHAATRWLTDGTVAKLSAAKRADAAARQQLVADRLGEFTVRADPAGYHCWWELPEQWRAEMFVAAAARRGIAVTPAAAFTVGSGHAPNAVRLALSAPPMDVLDHALGLLAAIARDDPDAALL